MMRLLWGFFCLVVIHQHVAAMESETRFYDPWVRQNTGELMRKASGFLDDERQRDNALILYTIVANRYNKQLDWKEKKACVDAIHNLGCLFLTSYNGYPLAYSNLKKAERLAQEIGYVQPNIYLNLGNLYAMNDKALKQTDIQDTAVSYFKKAFDLSVKKKSWNTLFTSYYDILWVGCLSNRREVIKTATARLRNLRITNHSPLLTYCVGMAKAFDAELAGNSRRAKSEFEKVTGLIDDRSENYPFSVLAVAVMARLKERTDCNAALDLFVEAKRIAEANGDEGRVTWLYNEFSEVYKKKGDQANANRYKMLYLERKDTDFENTQERTLRQMKFLDQLGQADRRIATMAKEKRLQHIALMVSVVAAAIFLTMFLALLIVYGRLRQKRIVLYEKTQELLNKEEKVKRSTLSDTLRIKDKIDTAMADVGMICDPDLTLKQLAEKIDEKYWLVSQVINEQYGVNFNQLLSDSRIKEVCRRFHDKESYARFTIEAMALSVGFKSRSNFVQVFKRVVGLTPSEYQRMASEKTK